MTVMFLHVFVRAIGRKEGVMVIAVVIVMVITAILSVGWVALLLTLIFRALVSSMFPKLSTGSKHTNFSKVPPISTPKPSVSNTAGGKKKD
jgi:hypothetical protein